MAGDDKRAEAQRAINELNKLVGLVVQQVNKPSINYRGDEHRFREILEFFNDATRAAGLSVAFPWDSLDEAEGAMKAHASGPGSYAVRREGVLSAVRPLREALQQVIDGYGANVLRLDKATWQLGEQLDSGGFARVYGVAGSGAPAVAKLIPKEPGAQREMLFEDLADVRNVVPILDTGEHGDFWVIVMPRATRSLRDRINTQGPLPVSDALLLIRDIAEALQDLQGRVVHRDIKPENVLLLNGRWCLADFGIARYAEASTSPDTRKAALTPQYASPEQWRYEHATQAADIYALGITIYEAVSGVTPFTGNSPEDFRDQHLHSPPPPLSGAPTALATLIDECLYKGPQARPTPTQILARTEGLSTAPASSGLAALQAANLAEVQRKARDDEAASRSHSESDRRAALFEAASHALDAIINELAEAIRSVSSAAEITAGAHVLRVVLGEGILGVDSLTAHQQLDLTSGRLDVIATARIRIVQPPNRTGYTGRSHSLWFTDAQAQGQYHWYETAFMRNAYSGDLRNEDPFAMTVDGDAYAALGPGLTAYQVAWPFTLLTPGELTHWISEWAHRLAAASAGALERPTLMPEKDPSGSWRLT